MNINLNTMVDEYIWKKHRYSDKMRIDNRIKNNIYFLLNNEIKLIKWMREKILKFV